MALATSNLVDMMITEYVNYLYVKEVEFPWSDYVSGNEKCPKKKIIGLLFKDLCLCLQGTPHGNTSEHSP